ncbi:hypothetical protein [Clostridium niameyense]|uniref:hypothetical protein n=1 Tax=Clostridium niameyense TaxID=1622073 RepID=UPI00101AED61|nr:hypothetical protein [Clostridium niameyense]
MIVSIFVYIRIDLEDIQKIKGKIIIIIAYRLKTIENTYQILVINNGKIEQKGTIRSYLKNRELIKDLLI